MDDARFDRLIAALGRGSSRRALLGTLLGAALAGVLSRPALAAKKKKKKKKKQCPFGRPRCGNDCCTLGETCLNNRCFHHCRDLDVNGGESDLNCGRACVGFLGAAGRCELGKTCVVDDDCRSGFCSQLTSGGNALCGQCNIDSDCGVTRPPRCLDHFCYECAADFDCPGATSPERRFCLFIPNVALGFNDFPCPPNQPCVCRECRNDGDCPAARPTCITAANTPHRGKCIECLDDGDCPAERPHCEPLGGAPGLEGRCLECQQDQHCPEGQLCDEQGRCEDLCPGRARRGRAGGVQAEGDNCPDTCANGIQDGDETDIDCGGSCPTKCGLGQGCAVQEDCCCGGGCVGGVCRQQCEDDSDCQGGFCLDCCVGCGDGSHCFASAVCP